MKRPWGPVPALVALFVLAGASAAPARDADRPTPSGLPVPRWVSLKFGEVNARSGPGDDYQTVWVYHAKRLPVQVIAETREWRKVCDPEHGAAWVHRRTTDGVRTIFRVKPQDLPLRSRPKASAGEVAVLAARSVAELDKCEDGWCRIKAGGVKAWAPASELWGVAEGQVCR